MDRLEAICQAEMILELYDRSLSVSDISNLVGAQESKTKEYIDIYKSKGADFLMDEVASRYKPKQHSGLSLDEAIIAANAIVMLHKQGMTIRKIADHVKPSVPTVNKYLKIYKKEGIIALRRKIRKGFADRNPKKDSRSYKTKTAQRNIDSDNSKAWEQVLYRSAGNV